MSSILLVMGESKARSRLMTHEKLTESEEKFLNAYTRHGAETFGNAYKSLISTRCWNGTKESAYVYASQIKNSPRVQTALKNKMREMGLTDVEVDMTLVELIRQNKDLKTKMRAIMEYNRLMGRGREKAQPLRVEIMNFGLKKQTSDR